MRIGAQDGSPVIVNGSLIEAGANSGGFVLAFGEDAESARLLSDAQKQWNDWILDRKDRMQKLVNSNSLMTNNDDLDKSMAWMMLTADELVTRQHGGWGYMQDFLGLPTFGVVICLLRCLEQCCVQDNLMWRKIFCCHLRNIKI